jgi:hypothetical protein
LRPQRHPARPQPSEDGERAHSTTQRFAGPSQRRQCGEATLRMFVMPGSVYLETK